jgi:hypothetical protein
MEWGLLAGSLAGVLLLAAVARLLGLGDGAIAGEAEACAAAADAVSGFLPQSALVSTDRRAALVLGADGGVVVLKQHGVHVAARRLARPLTASPDEHGVMIATGERMFGDVRLRLAAADRDRLAGFV